MSISIYILDPGVLRKNLHQLENQSLLNATPFNLADSKYTATEKVEAWSSYHMIFFYHSLHYLHFSRHCYFPASKYCMLIKFKAQITS